MSWSTRFGKWLVERDDAGWVVMWGDHLLVDRGHGGAAYFKCALCDLPFDDPDWPMECPYWDRPKRKRERSSR